MRLAAKTAVVTGAGSGIGRAIAVLFAREGATVIIHSLTESHAQATASELGRAGADPLSVVVGPIEEAETSELLAAAVDRAGSPLDILILNAGIDNFDPVDQVSRETWDRVLAVNLLGAFLACQVLLPRMRRPGGSVVHVASASALVGSPGMAAYSASKGGQVSLARQMAIDYAARGIRVNAICPGSIDTPMLRAGFDASPDPLAAERACVERHPLGRLGTADDVAYGALYLASEESAFVTGSQLVIDGGYSAI
jgi:NAD(P)-dependent dehydrogenase (short-subunit alcohol dehydrogenase family)